MTCIYCDDQPGLSENCYCRDATASSTHRQTQLGDICHRMLDCLPRPIPSRWIIEQLEQDCKRLLNMSYGEVGVYYLPLLNSIETSYRTDTSDDTTV